MKWRANLKHDVGQNAISFLVNNLIVSFFCEYAWQLSLALRLSKCFIRWCFMTRFNYIIKRCFVTNFNYIIIEWCFIFGFDGTIIEDALLTTSIMSLCFMDHFNYIIIKGCFMVKFGRVIFKWYFIIRFNYTIVRGALELDFITSSLDNAWWIYLAILLLRDALCMSLVILQVKRVLGHHYLK